MSFAVDNYKEPCFVQCLVEKESDSVIVPKVAKYISCS